MSPRARDASVSPFRAAHVVGGGWRAATGEVVRQLGELGPAYRLGIVYVSQAYADRLADIEVLLRQSTGVPHWVGAVGYGVIGTGLESVDEPAMAAMALPLADETFRVFSGVRDDTDPVSLAHADWLDSVAPPLILTHADPGNGLVPGLIRDLVDESDGHLVGGIACAAGRGAQLADGPSGGGLSGVMIAPDRTPVQTALTQGCTPVGPARRITRAEDTVIREIDGRPALDVFKEDIGARLARDLESCAGHIFAGLTVPGGDDRDYTVRELTGIDTRHRALAIGASVEAGDGLLFCRRDADSAVRDMARMLGGFERRLGGRPVRGAVYISCAARGPHQFRPPRREHQLIAKAFGNVPLVGLFANGEISRDRLYTHTGVLTLFM